MRPRAYDHPRPHTHLSTSVNVRPLKDDQKPSRKEAHDPFRSLSPFFPPSLSLAPHSSPLCHQSPLLTNPPKPPQNHHQTATAGPHTPSPAATFFPTTFFTFPLFHCILPQPLQPHFHKTIFLQFLFCFDNCTLFVQVCSCLWVGFLFFCRGWKFLELGFYLLV
jgi:hypothetical protein